MQGHRRGLQGSSQLRIAGGCQRLEQRKVSQCRQHAAGQDDGLAADAVRQGTEYKKERRAENQRQCDEQVGSGSVEFQHLREKEQCIELARVPHHGLPGSQPEQRNEHDLEVGPLTEGFAQRRT